MGVKRFKMYVRDNFAGERTCSFMFNEHDGLGLENKAHLSTIDKFTTNYNNGDEILQNFNNENFNEDIKLYSSYGKIDIFSSELIITHNYEGEKIGMPLYAPYKIITEVPLIDLATCDPKSPEFEAFLKLFLKTIRDEGYYHETLYSKYYNDLFKDYLIGYREGVDKEKSLSLMKEQLCGYTMMRKTYKDILKRNI